MEFLQGYPYNVHDEFSGPKDFDCLMAALKNVINDDSVLTSKFLFLLAGNHESGFRLILMNARWLLLTLFSLKTE